MNCQNLGFLRVHIIHKYEFRRYFAKNIQHLSSIRSANTNAEPVELAKNRTD